MTTTIRPVCRGGLTQSYPLYKVQSKRAGLIRTVVKQNPQLNPLRALKHMFKKSYNKTCNTARFLVKHFKAVQRAKM